MSKLRLFLLPLCCKCFGEIPELVNLTSTISLDVLFPGRADSEVIAKSFSEERKATMTATHSCDRELRFNFTDHRECEKAKRNGPMASNVHVCHKIGEATLKYQLTEILGCGVAAVVYSATYTDSGVHTPNDVLSLLSHQPKVIALKVAHDTQNDLESEINVLLSLQTELETGGKSNFVKLLFFDGSFKYMAMEKLGRSLTSLFDEKGKRFTISDRRRFYDDAIRQLTLLYARGYTHVDANSGNWVEDEKNNWRLIDFGLTCSMWDESKALELRLERWYTAGAEITCVDSLQSLSNGKVPDREVSLKMSWRYIFSFYNYFQVEDDHLPGAAERAKESFVQLLFEASDMEGCVCSRSHKSNDQSRKYVENLVTSSGDFDGFRNFVIEKLFAAVKLAQLPSGKVTYFTTPPEIKAFGVLPEHKYIRTGLDTCYPSGRATAKQSISRASTRSSLTSRNLRLSSN